MTLRQTLTQVWHDLSTGLVTGLSAVEQSVRSPGMSARIIDELLARGAVSPERAQRFHPRSTREETVFLALLDRGQIRQPSPGRYYVDERFARQGTSTRSGGDAPRGAAD